MFVTNLSPLAKYEARKWQERAASAHVLATEMLQRIRCHPTSVYAQTWADDAMHYQFQHACWSRHARHAMGLWD